MKNETNKYNKSNYYFSLIILLVLVIAYNIIFIFELIKNVKLVDSFNIVFIFGISIFSLDLIYSDYLKENYFIRRNKLKPHQLNLYYKNKSFMYGLIFISIIFVYLLFNNKFPSSINNTIIISCGYSFIHFIYHLIVYVIRINQLKKHKKSREH